ncbi:MAG TPA: hypothetical protein VHM00_14185 [Caldimonas sp.]|jgi:predicted hydrocarbon binding protein|nr:hypothetical protein [Caldimonas sp.]HEX2542220.1 hypothetical protein [Caldimonas sp.]
MAGLRDRLVFDAEGGTVRDGARRYVLMRPDVLMGAFARLEPKARSMALDAFAASAEEHGGDSLAAYFASVGGDASALLDATAAAAADLGWGRWSFRRDGDGLRLTVTGSPFAHGFVAAAADGPAEPVCTPIRGLLAAAARLVLASRASPGTAGAPAAPAALGAAAADRVDTEELACSACGHPCCEFIARRRAHRA